jgi:hypothetical protein
MLSGARAGAHAPGLSHGPKSSSSEICAPFWTLLAVKLSSAGDPGGRGRRPGRAPPATRAGAAEIMDG